MLAPVALALCVLAGPALAEDGKAMSGSACQPTSNARLGQLNRGGGSIFNFGSEIELIECPVVKDLNKIKRAQIVVIDRNPVADINCTLFTLRSNGTVLSSQSRQTTGSFTVARSLIFGAQGAAANGSYDLVCSLPPGPTEIVNYAVVEE